VAAARRKTRESERRKNRIRIEEMRSDPGDVCPTK
jgi:hypothetical protein